MKQSYINFILTISAFSLSLLANSTYASTPYLAGHKSACIAYDQVAWDPKQGDSLQTLVDSGFFPAGIDALVSQLAYSLRTPKQEDPINGSSRLLLSQIWYPIKTSEAENAEQTTHIDFFTNNPNKEDLAARLSQIINVGGALEFDEGDYPNAPASYGQLLFSDPEVVEYISNAPAGSYKNSPIAAGDGPFPIVILDSPGHDQFGLAEQLASRGYIVIAPTHPNDQFYDGLVDIGNPELDGLPVGGIPYGLNCDAAQINAAKPINGILDFNSNINHVWLADEGIYLGTLALNNSIQRTFQLRAIDIGILIERASELFEEQNVVDKDRVGLLGFSLGGNTVQLIASDDIRLFDPNIMPAEARAGLDRVDAVVTLAGNNRFLSDSSTASQLLKPTLALQGRQDLVVNLGSGTKYPMPSLKEPNSVFADNFENRYASGVAAMRVLIDRFGHSDFQLSEPLVACVEHGRSFDLVPLGCINTRPIDEQFSLAESPSGGLEIGGSYLARPLEERLGISTLYTAAWFDLYVKGEVCTENPDIKIDGKIIESTLNNVKRLQKNLFKSASIQRKHRNLVGGGDKPFSKKGLGKKCK